MMKKVSFKLSRGEVAFLLLLLVIFVSEPTFAQGENAITQATRSIKT